MTDDKGAGEGPYRVERNPEALYWEEWDVKCSGRFVSSYCLEHQAHRACRELNAAYVEGRKAERERCARIAESHVTKFNGFQIADAIRGGQDAK